MLNKKTITFLSVIVLISGSLIISGSSCGNNPIGVKAPTSTTTTTTPGTFTLTSSAFLDGGTIPKKYVYTSQGGSNASIPLSWTNTPSDTKSFALLMEDITISYIHWLVINIPSTASSLAEGASLTSMPQGSKELDNSFTGAGYMGPEPPGVSHSYKITLYALTVASVNLANSTDIATFKNSISGKISAQSSITGSYGGQQAAQVSLSTDVQPIFTNNCVACHGGSGGLALDSGMSYNYLVGQGGAGVASEVDPSMKRVKPSDSANSVLYLKVSGTTKGTRMPPSGALSSANIQTIKDWIDQGAANN